MSLLHPTRPDTPHLTRLRPAAALPGGSFEVTGDHLTSTGPPRPFFGDSEGSLNLLRSTRAEIKVPDGAIAGDLALRYPDHTTNHLAANIAVPMADELYMVGNPAADRDGSVFAMVSGPRGTRVPIAIYRIGRDMQVRPFVRDLLNVSSLALGPDGYLYASSRAEGAVYRISPEGAVSTFAEGMGIATGLAFDRDGNLYVGDRSGTIFRLGPHGQHNAAEIFVFATLEPSVAAYHLAFRDDGTLLVTAPTTSSNQAIHSIAPDGTVGTFYRGLGRPQGLALDTEGRVYVAASLHGQRGIVRITPDGKIADLLISGNDLVGLCFLDDGAAALATVNTLFTVALDIEGRLLA